MTKKVKISFLILVWSIVVIQMYVNYQDRNRLQRIEQSSRAVTAFSATEEESEGNMIIGQGYFGDMEISENMKKEMLVNLAQKLEIPGEYTLNHSEKEDIVQWTLTGVGENDITNLHIISKAELDKTEQYIVVEIRTTCVEQDIYAHYERVEQVLIEIGLEEKPEMEMKIEKNGKRWKIEKS